MATAAWPVIDGQYVVSDPKAPVAVCALTSVELLPGLAAISGVAIAGVLQTANLGVERLVTNVAANPNIRFVIVCGKESPIFQPGQALVSLHENGTEGNASIRGAVGYEPVVPNLDPDLIARFRRQVELLDWSGVTVVADVGSRVNALVSRNPGPFVAESARSVSAESQFKSLRPGGRREPLQYDPRGYFVISLDKPAEQVVVRHYSQDHRPQHEMRGRNPGSILLGLLRESLVTQLSHAGYLGAELEKAGIALRAGLRYEQDRPLRLPVIAKATESSAAPRPPIRAAMTVDEVARKVAGDEIDVVVEANEATDPKTVTGVVLEPSQADPFGEFARTDRLVTAHIRDDTRFAMGSADDVRPNAILRVRGSMGEGAEIAADSVVVLTAVARITG